MADEKVKARTRKVEVSSLLAIDSPGVVWFLDAFDDLRQVPGVIFGGGGSGEPSTPSRPAPEPLPEAAQFIAYCSSDHSPEMSSVTVDGHWIGALVNSFGEAADEAAAHQDGFASVFLYVNAALVGPVTMS